MIPHRHMGEAFFDVCLFWACALFILILMTCANV